MILRFKSIKLLVKWHAVFSLLLYREEDIYDIAAPNDSKSYI